MYGPEICLNPEVIDAYVASFVELKFVDDVPWSDESTDKVVEASLMLKRDVQRLV